MQGLLLLMIMYNFLPRNLMTMAASGFVANLNDGLEAELIAEAVHKSADTRQVVKIERR